jgi:hypothetical protein
MKSDTKKEGKGEAKNTVRQSCKGCKKAHKKQCNPIRGKIWDSALRRGSK